MAQAFPIVSSIDLAEQESHPIGEFTDGVRDARGRVYIADRLMANVKVYTSSGSLSGVVGRSGDGPGEFNQLLGLGIAEAAGELHTADAGNARITRFALPTWDVLDTYTPHFAPLLRGIRAADDGTAIVTGFLSVSDSGPGRGATILNPEDSVLNSVLTFPPRLRAKAYVSSTLAAIADHFESYFYTVLNTESTIHRIDLHGEARDSITLPAAFFAGMDFPDEYGGPEIDRPFFRRQSMIHRMTVLSDSALVLTMSFFSHEADASLRRLVLVNWTNQPSLVVASELCDCQVVDAAGDTLFVLTGMLLGDTPRLEARLVNPAVPQQTPNRGGDTENALFPVVREVILEPPFEHPIGMFGQATISQTGAVYIADFGMREVKAFHADGSFAGILGRSGRGPGKYATPTGVSTSPFDSTITVTDASLGRVLQFNPNQPEAAVTHPVLNSGIGMADAYQGPGDTLLVVGYPIAPSGDTNFLAALVLTSDSLIKPLLPMPKRAQTVPAMGSVVRAIATQGKSYLYLAVNSEPTLYRATYDGTLTDSVRLPQTIFTGADVPPDLDPETALDDVWKHGQWLMQMVAVDDATLALEIWSYVENIDEHRQTIALVPWDNPASAIASPLCDCRLLGHRGDTLGVMRGTDAGPFRIEWIPVSTWKRSS